MFWHWNCDFGTGFKIQITRHACIGGLLYLGGLRFLQFLTAVFRFLTNIIAVFRFCRLLRFAEMDVFLTRFSDLSYPHSGFSVFEKYAVCGNSSPYCGLRIFASLFLLRLAMCCHSPPYHGLRFAPVKCSKRLMKRVLDIFLRSIDIFQYPVIRWITIAIVFTVRSFEINEV